MSVAGSRTGIARFVFLKARYPLATTRAFTPRLTARHRTLPRRTPRLLLRRLSGNRRRRTEGARAGTFPHSPAHGTQTPMGIFVRDGNDLFPMREQPYEAEAVLQRLLASHPGLLAGDEDGKRRGVLVQREHGIGDAEGAGGRWSLDHLFLDDEGVPTL